MEELSALVGPEGEDWRVPVSELESRQINLQKSLQESGYSGALIQTPVDLYYYSGGRQNGTLFIPAEGESRLFVRRSLSRAIHESGGENSPHIIEKFPRMAEFSEQINCSPAMQFSDLPNGFATHFASKVGANQNCSQIIHNQREVKSSWELEMMEDGAQIQLAMFDAVEKLGGLGVSELELVAAAEAVSRAAGFGGNVQMRRFPLQCDRGVIVSGRAGGIPSFFDSAIGGTGPHPMSSMGSGFSKIKANEPVLVDLVHVHRGYVVDTTRMFVAGKLSQEWQERLDDMVSIKEVVVDVLDQGLDCSEAWRQGHALANELGHESHLMGMAPDQSRFLGHSVGLQLDESPVVAEGFDRPLPIGGTMAIEPKVVHSNGSIGTEDTWIRDEEGMKPITADGAIPWITEW
ncbi:MAG: M24 family metallopeptidase [Candidatus Poseidoniaceae archaeon]|jgi:Xaa-Pro aminopeptidase|nr:M24 family metallopeptidase [Candidatus Poseidoniaceae archaeon]